MSFKPGLTCVILDGLGLCKQERAGPVQGETGLSCATYSGSVLPQKCRVAFSWPCQHLSKLHDQLALDGAGLLNCAGQSCVSLPFMLHLQRVGPASTQYASVPTRLAGQTGQTATFLFDLAPTGQTALPVWYPYYMYCTVPVSLTYDSYMVQTSLNYDMILCGT